MSVIRFHKVVASLPTTLDPDTLYMVRAGEGFDLYMSDSTGSIAHPINIRPHAGAIAWPRRSATPKIVGDVASTTLTTTVFTSQRLSFVPFTVPRQVELTGLRISITTAATGTASIGIYSNTQVSGDDAPGDLLAGVTGLDTSTTGDKTGTLSYALNPGTIYWACLITSANPAGRAVPTGAAQMSLGRQVNSTGAIAYLYAGGSGSTLPSTAPTSLTAGTGTIPAIYLVGS